MNTTQLRAVAGIVWAIASVVSAFAGVYCNCWWLIGLAAVSMIMTHVLIPSGADHAPAGEIQNNSSSNSK